MIELLKNILVAVLVLLVTFVMGVLTVILSFVWYGGMLFLIILFGAWVWEIFT